MAKRPHPQATENTSTYKIDQHGAQRIDSEHDVELAEMVRRWPNVPKHVQRTIVELIRAASK